MCGPLVNPRDICVQRRNTTERFYDDRPCLPSADTKALLVLALVEKAATAQEISWFGVLSKRTAVTSHGT
jgi:hypothetical protein